MAYVYDKTDDIWYGHSSDTKPTNVDVNEKCYEYESGNIWIYDGATWWPM